jgi:Bacterial DNA-binding protein
MNVGNVQKVRIGGLVQVTVRVEPVRKGCNPATGEQITIIAQPGRIDVRAQLLARATGALPSVQRACRRVAA